MENNKLQAIKKDAAMSMDDLARMSQAFVASKLFKDVENAAMAMVKIQAGIEMGIKPFAAMSGIHIIQGKAVPGASVIASCIKNSGKYNYKIMQMTNELCSIDVYENGEIIGVSAFSIEDARKAETKNLGKYPRNMLFARAISNAAKWYCPDVFDCAVYTEDEIESEYEDLTKPANTQEDKDKKEFGRFKALVDKAQTIEDVKKLFDCATNDEEKLICNKRAEEIDISNNSKEEITTKSDIPQTEETVGKTDYEDTVKVLSALEIISKANTIDDLKTALSVLTKKADREAYDKKFKELNTK